MSDIKCVCAANSLYLPSNLNTKEFEDEEDEAWRPFKCNIVCECGTWPSRLYLEVRRNRQKIIPEYIIYVTNSKDIWQTSCPMDDTFHRLARLYQYSERMDNEHTFMTIKLVPNGLQMDIRCMEPVIPENDRFECSLELPLDDDEEQSQVQSQAQPQPQPQAEADSYEPSYQSPEMYAQVENDSYHSPEIEAQPLDGWNLWGTNDPEPRKLIVDFNLGGEHHSESYIVPDDFQFAEFRQMVADLITRSVKRPITEEEPIITPNATPTPKKSKTTSMVFEGIQCVFTTCESNQQRNKCIKLITTHGGKVMNDFDDNTDTDNTYLICDKKRYTRKFAEAIIRGILCINIDWIEYCIKMDQFVSIHNYQICDLLSNQTPLEGQTFYVKLDKKTVKETNVNVKRLIELAGGKISTDSRSSSDNSIITEQHVHNLLKLIIKE